MLQQCPIQTSSYQAKRSFTLALRCAVRLNKLYCKAEFIHECKAFFTGFFITFLHAHFQFWGRKHLTYRSISICYPQKWTWMWLHELNKVQFQENSISHLWHRILLAVCKCYGKRCSSSLALKKCLLGVWVWIQLHAALPAAAITMQQCTTQCNANMNRYNFFTNPWKKCMKLIGPYSQKRTKFSPSLIQE